MFYLFLFKYLRCLCCLKYFFLIISYS